MKNRIKLKRPWFGLYVLLWLTLFSSCDDDKMNEHYKVPSDAKSIWEALTEKGNYSIFLEAADATGFRSLLEGRSILTVMAPDNNAFSSYLEGKGYSSIDEMDKEELSKLIGFHLLYYSYNKERLVNFCPEGDLATNEDLVKSAGLYYKFRTWSSSSPTVETLLDKNYTVYHLDRYIPVFSHLFFEVKGIDAKTNYEYFYPNSTWTGADGFNVSNASVKEYTLMATNGYIYTVNQVLEPLETIYTEMKDRPEYSIFFKLYNNYTSYSYDKTLSDDYGTALGVDSLYLHRHGELPPIAMEWPVSSFQNVSLLSTVGYGIFAPSNNAMNNFFENFWKVGEYESLYDVDPLLMEYFLYQFVYSGSIVFPEEITKGKIKNLFGVPFNYVNPATVKDKAICVNGSFYGMDELKNPALFEAVVGPTFQYKKYISYLYALHGSKLLTSYASLDTRYTLLIPDNIQMAGSGYELKTNTTGTSLQMNSENGWVDVSSTTMQNMANMHTINGIGGLKTTGKQAYPVQTTFSYLFVKDGQITSNALFNKLLEPDYVATGGNPFVPFKEITYAGGDWSNGKAYSYENPEIFMPESSDGLAYALAICNDNRYPYNSFVQLLKKAGMVNGTTIPILIGSRFIAFIPTNEAITAAIANNEIPGIKNGTMNADGTVTVADENYDVKNLKEYLQSHFLRSTENTIATYPYLGSGFKTGTYTTVSAKKLGYIDNGNSLNITIEGGSGQSKVISKYDYFPFAFKDGCLHLIEKIF